MKICNKCKINKELSEFGTRKRLKSGIRGTCKLCEKESQTLNKRTKSGLVTFIYSNQRVNSRTRKHSMPTYTNKQLTEWLLNDWLFDLLFNNWLNCGCLKDMIPSIDRLDESRGYSFDNIQIMTSLDNRNKNCSDIRSGKTIHGNKPQVAVNQYSMDGTFIRSYISMSEAERISSVDQGAISKCCYGKKYIKSAGGFVWKLKEVK